MTSFEFRIGGREQAGSRFMAAVKEQLLKALVSEKASRRLAHQEPLTQQAIATKLGVNRSVINRRFAGLENLTTRTIGELLWAIGWEPYFEARKTKAAEESNESTVIAYDFRASTSNTSDPQTTKIAIGAR